MGKCQCGRLKGNPCGPLRPNTINVTMPVADLREMMNSLPNLQLLAGVENQEKRSKLPTEWLSTFESDEKRTEYLNLHLLGNVPDDLLGFKSFHSARRESLKSEITTLLT